jgi:hypothetical protein
MRYPMRVVFESAWPATVALLVFGCTGTVGDASSSETTGTETSNSSTPTFGTVHHHALVQQRASAYAVPGGDE